MPFSESRTLRTCLRESSVSFEIRFKTSDLVGAPLLFAIPTLLLRIADGERATLQPRRILGAENSTGVRVRLATIKAIPKPFRKSWDFIPGGSLGFSYLRQEKHSATRESGSGAKPYRPATTWWNGTRVVAGGQSSLEFPRIHLPQPLPKIRVAAGSRWCWRRVALQTYTRRIRSVCNSRIAYGGKSETLRC